jgi:hypothetical protein
MVNGFALNVDQKLFKNNRVKFVNHLLSKIMIFFQVMMMVENRFILTMTQKL